LVVQLQAFITIFLAWAWLGEKPRPAQLTGAGVALAGIIIIGSERLGGASLLPFLMVIGGAFCWGIGNLIAKIAGKVDMFAFVVWSSLAAPLPLAALSLAFEGRAGLAGLAHPSLALILSVAGLAYGGTILGFGLWSRLLARYAAAAVAPFALLIPIVGMIAGAMVFGEPLSAIEVLGAALVMAGLTINVFGDRLLRRRPRAA
jgi:O-acetylserine/cysteine efflux transporter